MPTLEVRCLSNEDVYKDLVRIPEKYRKDKDGRTIEESTVCWIHGAPRVSLAVLRGYQIQPDGPEIHMDDRTRNRLGVHLGESYGFEFKVARLWGELKWAWKASETGYRVASRLAIVGLILGLLAFLPVFWDLLSWLMRQLIKIHHLS